MGGLHLLLFIYYLLCVYLAMLCGLWDLSSPTKDQTPALGAQSSNHWTTREFIYLFHYYYLVVGFPGGSDGKESACNVRDLNSIPGSGRSSTVGNSNPFQYSCLKISRQEEAGRLQSIRLQSQIRLQN